MSKAFFIDTYWVPRKVHQEIFKLQDSLQLETDPQLQKSYHTFLAHIYVNMRLNSLKAERKKPANSIVVNRNIEKSAQEIHWEYEIGVPIPNSLIRSELHRRFDTGLLEELGIINWINHTHGRGEGRSRLYRLTNFEKISKLHSEHFLHSWVLYLNGKKSGLVNIMSMSGSSKDKAGKQTSLDLNGLTKKQVPDFIIQSEQCFKPCPINPHHIINLVEDLDIKATIDEEKLIRIKKKLREKYPDADIKLLREKQVYKNALTKVKKSKALHRNFITCLSTILEREPHKKEDDFWEYRAAYKLQTSGRISEQHGGFQTLHKAGKFLLLAGIPNIYNYDIENCQSVILEQELSDAEIACDWLKNYNANKNLRKQYADEIGISEGCWKDAYYAIIMGAEDTYFGSAFNSILEEGGDYEIARGQTDKFLEKISPLLEASAQWRDFLFTTTDKQYVSKYRGYRWRNACGMLYRDYKKSKDNLPLSGKHLVTNKTEIKRIKRKIAAFYLQGAEALVIHKLTIACTKQNIPVYKNEYDGLITGKEIPRPLFKKIAKQNGYPALEISPKPICKPEKMKQIMKHCGREEPYAYVVME